MKDTIELIINEINKEMVCYVDEERQKEIDQCYREILEKHLLK